MTIALFRLRVCMTVIVLLPALACCPALALDTDGDGLPDDVERRLGSRPDFAEQFELLAEDDVGDADAQVGGGYDIAAIHCANVARDRWLWAVSFAEPHDPSNAICTIHLDIDDDPATGRATNGVEVAYVSYGGQSKTKVYIEGPAAERIPEGRMAVVDGVIYYCGDIGLNELNGRTLYRLRVHCQTIEPAVVRDRFGSEHVEGPGNSDIDPPEVRDVGYFAGTVVGPDGQPVAGATVIGHHLTQDRPLDPFSPALEVQTDAEGRFRAEVAPTSYWVSAHAGDLATTHEIWDAWPHTIGAGSVMEKQIPLVQGGTVFGRVVAAESGEMLPHTKLVFDNGRTGVADGEGNFEVQGISFGEHSVVGLAPGMAHSRADFNNAGQARCEVLLEMHRGYTVRGTVTDEAGNPVEGATVRDHYSGSIFHCYMRRCVTDARGRYELSGYSRSRDLWSLGVEHPDFASQSKHSIPPPPEGEDGVVDFVLTSGWAVAGRVLDGQGNPVAGAKVSYNLSECYVHYASTETDRDGRFWLDKLASDREEYILVQGAGYAPAYQKAVPGRGEDVPQLEFTVEPEHTAAGRVVDRDGNPVEGFTLRAQMSVPGHCGSNYIGRTYTTDADGRFEIKGLPGVGVTVDAYGVGYSAIRDHPLALDGAENTLAVDPPGVIRGRVVDADTGEPVREFNVCLDFPSETLPDEPKGGISCHLTTGGQDCRSDEGLFTVDGLTTRKGYAVIVSAEGYAPTRVERVTAAPAESEDWPVEITLGEGQTLTGTLTAGEGGAPVEGAEVTLLTQTGRYGYFDMSVLKEPERRGFSRSTVTSGADGGFKFRGVADHGTKILMVESDDFATVLRRDIEVTEPMQIALAQAGTISGSVAGYIDGGFEGVSIRVYAGNVEWAHEPVADDGSFRITGLPPGEYDLSLWLSAPGGNASMRSRSVDVELAEGASVGVDFGALEGVDISGTLTLRGEPSVGASVEVYPVGDRSGRVACYVGAGGRWSLSRIPPGEYELFAHRQNFADLTGPSYSLREAVTVGQQDITRDLSFNPGVLTGSVRDAGGAPIAGALVEAHPRAPDCEPVARISAYRDRETDQWRVHAWETTNYVYEGLRSTRRLGERIDRLQRASGTSAAGGEYWVVDLPAGELVLTAHAPQSPVPAILEPITIPEGAGDVPLEIALDLSGALRMRVVSEAGEPIEGARIFLCTPDGVQIASQARRLLTPPEQLAECTTGGCSPGRAEYAREPILTDADGRVELEGIHACDYGAWIIAPGHAATFVSGGPAEAGAEAPIRLAPAGTLRFRVAESALEGTEQPLLTWRITDAVTGRAVFPGGPVQEDELVETGAVMLVGESASGFAVDTLAAGTYAVRWEVHGLATEGDGSEPMLLSGEAQVQIAPGGEALLTIER